MSSSIARCTSSILACSTSQTVVLCDSVTTCLKVTHETLVPLMLVRGILMEMGIFGDCARDGFKEPLKVAYAHFLTWRKPLGVQLCFVESLP